MLMKLNGNVVAQMLFGRRFDDSETGFMHFFNSITNTFRIASYAMQVYIDQCNIYLHALTIWDHA